MLLYYEKLFSELNVHMAGGRASPHKVAMLLAVMDLIEKGQLTENRIDYAEPLISKFAQSFRELKIPGGSSRPIYPFFNLRKDGFWHHALKPGRSAAYHELSTVTSRKQVERHVAFAYLDDELFELLGTPPVCALLRAALLGNTSITPEERLARLRVNGWNWLECEACVQDYFDMLSKELRNDPYNKSAHRKVLMTKLRGRSDSSVERKHQNISAILLELGFTYISGYKPLLNYQKQLRNAVMAHLAGQKRDLEQINIVRDINPPPFTGKWENVLDPKIPERIPAVTPPNRRYLAQHVNFSRREIENRQLGASGEQFVVQFERFRLTCAGREDLAREVEWSSKKQGDGLGYDVRSFPIGANGVPREDELFIEVKTTNRGKFQPFFISDNEVEFSREFSRNYCLYRVYDFQSPKRRLFQLPGDVDHHVCLNPVLYRAHVG